MVKVFNLFGTTTLLLFSFSPAVRAELLFDRGLPADHINDSPGETRANLRWTGGFDNQNFYGDDFVIGEVGDRYVINHIRTWAVLGYREEGPAKPDEMGDWFSQVRLLGGLPADEYLPLLASGNLNLNASTTDNPSVVISRVTYPDEAGSSYNNFGPRTTLWQIDFYNLNWVVEGGTRYNFSVQGTGRQFEGEDYFHAWYNHATSAQFDSVPQQGADDLMLVFSSGGEFVRIAEAEEHWDKPTDINIQVFGELFEADSPIVNSSSEPSIVSVARALCDADLLTGRNCQRAVIEAEQGRLDRRSQLLRDVVDEATARFRREYDIPPNVDVQIGFEGPLNEVALMQLHDLLDQLNQAGALSERVYAQLKADLDGGQIAIASDLYRLALDRMRLFEALEPARVSPTLDQFYDVDIISAGSRTDLLAALQEGSLDDPIEFLQYIDQAVVFDLRNYSNQPEEYFPDIHQTIAEMLLKTGVIVGTFSDFEFVLRPNQEWAAIAERLAELESNSDDVVLPDYYDAVVSVKVSDRHYEHASFYGASQSEGDFWGRLEPEALVNLFNKILRDQASAYRLYTVVPSYSYYDFWISADRDARFGVVALTEAQAQIYFGYEVLFDPAADLTSDRIEELLTLFEQIGLVEHLTRDQIEAGRNRIAQSYITRFYELFEAFDHVLLSFEWSLAILITPTRH